MEGYLISPATRAKLEEVIGDTSGDTAPGFGKAPTGRQPVYVLITGAAVSGLYPATVQYWRESDDTWQDLTTAAKVRVPNGEVLDEDVRYPAQRVGDSSPGVATYMTLMGEGGTPEGEWQEVVIPPITCVDGNITYSTVWVRVLETSETDPNAEEGRE